MPCVLGVGFPRSYERGLIEAKFHTVFEAVFLLPFRVHMNAASLKQQV